MTAVCHICDSTCTADVSPQTTRVLSLSLHADCLVEGGWPAVKRRQAFVGSTERMAIHTRLDLQAINQAVAQIDQRLLNNGVATRLATTGRCVAHVPPMTHRSLNSIGGAGGEREDVSGACAGSGGAV